MIRRLVLLTVLSFSLVWTRPAYSQGQGEMRIPENGASLLNPKVQDFLRAKGTDYGLKATEDGRLNYQKPDLKGRLVSRPLDPETARRLMALMAAGTPEEAEIRMAMALEAYLQPRLGAQAASYDHKLFAKGPDGRRRLTQMGRNCLMDILTAEDGLNFAPPSESPKTKKEKKISALTALRAMEKAGVLIANHLAGGGLQAGADSAAAGFDGSVTQGVRALESYDWNKDGDPVLIRKNSKENGLYMYSVGGTGEAAPSEYLRVMIAARNPVSVDRLKMTAADSDASVYAEAGLDPELMKRHGAKVVRAVDNLVAIDVPVSEAAKLGSALSDDGVASRPARLFQMAADAVRKGPAWPDPLYSMLPFSTEGVALALPSPKGRGDAEIRPMNSDSRGIMRTDKLAAKGMDGAGAVVAIVDSGLDMSHPDFEDRVAAYIDLTDGGTKDFVGHGTHVAGSIGGSGKASEGKYKGTAPQTKLVILKVFGKEGSTSEDTILAALKAAKSLPKDIRPQVVNMSLGGPGDAETDPLSVMANEMMVKDNIVMAVAAGNSGPGKKTIGSPGNARYVLTVTGTNKQQTFPFFPSRGPVTTSKGKTWNKPDLATIAGDVSATQRLRHFVGKLLPSLKGGQVTPQEEPADPGCFYAPGGVISSRSKDDEDSQCMVKGNPAYRYMTGTSMATPLAAGVAADMVGYLKSKNHAYKAAEVKALLMETATDLKEKPEVQGAGMLNGDKLATVLEQRVKMGLPVGNIAFSIAHRTSRWDEFQMKKGGRFERTAMGILDTKTGHLIHNDAEFDTLVDTLDKDYKDMNIFTRMVRKVQYWWES